MITPSKQGNRFNRLLLLILQVVFMAPLAHAELTLLDNLEEILARVEEANGGREVIEAATSLRVNGTINTDGAVVDFILIKKRPDLVKITTMYKQRTIDIGHDGEVIWRRVRTPIGEEVEVISDSPDGVSFLETDFDGPLVGVAEDGYKREFIGTERIGRVEYYKVKITKPNGSFAVHYIDTRSFRELKTEYSSISDSGEPTQTTAEYSDYTRVGGIWVAQTIKRTGAEMKDEILNITKAEVNPGLFSRFFEKPEITEE